MLWFRKFAVIVTAALVMSALVTVAQASTRKGVSAFQRGKYDEAVKLLAPEADKGDPDAMYILGKIYASGSGVEKDIGKAAGYFQKAAELGHAEAQQSLGSALMLGDGIDQDMIEALKWFIISARNGNKDGGTYANNVSRFMSREMLLEARSKALIWQQEFDKAGDAKTEKPK